MRQLARGDLLDLVRLCEEHAAYEGAVWRDHDRVERLGALFLDVPDARCFVLDGEAELAGFATVILERSTWDAAHFAHLDCLYFRPSYRGQGWGRLMLKEVARSVIEWGAINLQWQTPEWNVDAVRFYDRLGAQSERKLRFGMTLEACQFLIAPTPLKEEGE